MPKVKYLQNIFEVIRLSLGDFNIIETFGEHNLEHDM